MFVKPTYEKKNETCVDIFDLVKRGLTYELHTELLRRPERLHEQMPTWGGDVFLHACKNNKLQIVRLLLHWEYIDVDSIDFSGCTPLYFCVQKRLLEIMMILLDRGADAHKRSFEGMSPLMVACGYGYQDIACLLIERQGVFKTFAIAAGGGGKSSLVDVRAQPKSRDRGLHDTRHKHKMQQSDKKDSVSLIDTAYRSRHKGKDNPKGIPSHDMESQYKDEWQDTLRLDNPLHTACLRGHMHIVTMFMNMGLNVRSRGKSFNTALHYACSNGHTEIIQLLLQKGADPFAINDDGDTPLHCACVNGQIYTAISLIYSQVCSFLPFYILLEANIGIMLAICINSNMTFFLFFF